MSVEQEGQEVRPAIKAEPLPQAGESLRRRMWDVFLDRAAPWALMGLMAVVFTGLEWVRWFFDVQATWKGATGMTVMTGIFGVVALRKWQGAMRDFDTMKRGLLGERHVGHYLDDVCRGVGYRVLHDVPGEGFNVDHLLIGPGGVFVLETKYRSKPAEGWAKMVFDGVQLTRPDGGYDVETVKQAKACGDFVRKLLEKRLGRRVYVFPVVMVPGWWIEDEGPRPRSVWVMADDSLHKFLANEGGRLTPEDMGLVYESLAEYVRNKGK